MKRRVEGMERPGRRALGYLHQAGQGDTRSETALKQTWHNGKEAAKDDDRGWLYRKVQAERGLAFPWRRKRQTMLQDCGGETDEWIAAETPCKIRLYARWFRPRCLTVFVLFPLPIPFCRALCFPRLDSDEAPRNCFSARWTQTCRRLRPSRPLEAAHSCRRLACVILPLLA